MNERFAAEPATCDSAFELKHLLEKFGPVTGRYLATYPANDWEARLQIHIESWGDAERAKAKVVLRRAKESRALIRATNPYDERETWVQNITRTQSSESRFDGVVVSRASAGTFPSVEELELPPTAAEPVTAKKAEYVRVSRTLLAASPEIHFIDAYLDPCDRDRHVVLQEMLQIAGRGRCECAYVWVSSNRLKHTSSETIAALRRTAEDAGFVSPRRVHLRAFTDAGRDVRVHDRHLLSLYGAIRFEHGFQELTGKRTAKVSPEGPASHLLLLKTFYEGKHDLGVEEFLIDV